MGPAMKSRNDGLMAGLPSSGINLAKNGFVPGTQRQSLQWQRPHLEHLCIVSN